MKNWYPKILTGGSLVGLIASFWQAVERVHMLKTDSFSLSCNLNPVIDCGSVLDHRLSALFGFPNAFIGMVVFAMLFAAGVFLLSGSKPTLIFRRFVMALSTVLILFSFWFFGVSLYVIGKVCLFCIFIWAASVPLFWYGALYYLQESNRKKRWQQAIYQFGIKNHLNVLAAVYTVMFMLFLINFKDYYFG
jgi:uncharacterized membrane protein